MQIDNVWSKFLNEEENLKIFNLLGGRCTTIATTVIQLYVTYPPYHAEWHKKETGVLCFVKDHHRMNWFLRLFSLDRDTLVWEHGIYRNIEYRAVTPFLHVFEGELGMVAFNFLDIDDGYDFLRIVNENIHGLNGNGTRVRESKLLQRTRTFTKGDIRQAMRKERFTQVWTTFQLFSVY